MQLCQGRVINSRAIRGRALLRRERSVNVAAGRLESRPAEGRMNPELISWDRGKFAD
jgi:hypothetical protein